MRNTVACTHSFIGSSGDHLTSSNSCKGRRSVRTWHVCGGQNHGYYPDRFTPRHTRQRGVPGTEGCETVTHAHDDASGWYGKSDRHEGGDCAQRALNRSRGTVRTTCRHFGALHVSPLANQGLTPGSRKRNRGHKSGAQRIRHRSRGTAQTTFRHFGVLHVSLAGNHDRTSGEHVFSPLVTFADDTYAWATHFLFDSHQIRQRSKGTVQTTFRHFGVLHVSLAGNCDRVSGQRVPSPLIISVCDTYAWATYSLFDYSSHGSRRSMATLGSHDKPLRGRVLVDGVVTYRPSDFDGEVTKDERTASFFVLDEKINIARETVALSGPFCGLSGTPVDANKLKATARQNQIEFVLLVNVGLDEGSAETAKQRLGAMKGTLVTALQDIDGSDGRTCKAGASSTDYVCVTVDKDGMPASVGLSLAAFRVNLKVDSYLTCELVQKSLRVLQRGGQSLLFCDKTVRGTWPTHNTEAGTHYLHRLLVPSTREGQMVPTQILRSEESVTVMREKLEAPLKKLGLTVNTALVLYKDILPGRTIGCTVFVFDVTVVSYLLLAEPGLGSIGKMLFESQMQLIRPLVYSTQMEDGEIRENMIDDQMWPALPGANPYVGMNVDLRHPLEGAPLLAPHLLDLLPFSAVFQCSPERLGTGPVVAIQHFVTGDINADIVIGHVASEIISALSEILHPDHEHLTFEYWGPRVGVQHVWHKGANTICRILIVVANGQQHQLIVDRFHGTFFPWDFARRQVAYISYPDCMCIGCQTRRKRENGYGCVDCGSKGHLSKDVDCPHLQERIKAGETRRAAKQGHEMSTMGQPTLTGSAAGTATSGPSTSAAHATAGEPTTAARGSSTSTADATLPVIPQGSVPSSNLEGQNGQGNKKGMGRGGPSGRGRGGRGVARAEYNWLCGFCHKPNGALFHNSKYCVKPFLLPPLSELSKSACLFCNHDHFFMRCPIVMENGVCVLPIAYVNMARELKYPVIEVQGQLRLNVAASLPRLTEAHSSANGSGESSASSQASSDGGWANSEIVLSGGEDQKSMQLQLQQTMNAFGDKLMMQMGRQLTERLGEVTASMNQMSQAHNQLQERVVQQTTTTTEMFSNLQERAEATTELFSTLKERVEECRREAKEAQEKGDKKLEEALKKMAAAAKSIVGEKPKGGKGVSAGDSGVKDRASTFSMEP